MQRYLPSEIQSKMENNRTNQHRCKFPTVVEEAHSDLGNTKEDEAQGVRGEACRGETIDRRDATAIVVDRPLILRRYVAHGC